MRPEAIVVVRSVGDKHLRFEEGGEAFTVQGFVPKLAVERLDVRPELALTLGEGRPGFPGVGGVDEFTHVAPLRPLPHAAPLKESR